MTAGSPPSRDSALVGLIGFLAILPAEAPAQAPWRLSTEPTTVIGSMDGPPALTLHDVRGVVRAVDGMIVVADGGSMELRVFTAAGHFVRSFGRAGDGPGEFRSLGWIDMCGGEAIVAYDSFRDRVTKWTVDGLLLEDFAVEGPGDMPPYRVSCGPFGDFAVVGWPDVAVSRTLGPYRPNVPIGVSNERGRRERLIGHFPGAERMRTGSNDRPHPFGKSTIVRMGAPGVYVGTADSFAIDLIAPNGDRRTFGRPRPAVRLARPMLERWVDAYLERAPPEQRPSLRRSLLDGEWSEWLPETPPAYADFLIDRLGFVWVAPFVIGSPGDGASVEWSVFDPVGRFVATVPVPAHFWPTDIGADYVLGVSTDALDVQRVHRYALFRLAGSPFRNGGALVRSGFATVAWVGLNVLCAPTGSQRSRTWPTGHRRMLWHTVTGGRHEPRVGARGSGGSRANAP